MICLVFIYVEGHSSTYYVSNSGSDSYAGSEVAPWETIAKVESSAGANDKVYFNQADKWRDQLTVPASNMTFGAYGTGAKPIISGADLMIDLTLEADNVWCTPTAITPGQVFFDGNPGSEEATKATLDTALEWAYEYPNSLHFYSAGPTTEYTNPGIEAAQRDYGIDFDPGTDYVTIAGLQTEKCNATGIYMYAHVDTMSNINIQNITSTQNVDVGVVFSSWGATIHDCSIRDSVVSYNGATGIHFGSVSVNCTADNNVVHNNAQLMGVNYTSGIRSCCVSGNCNGIVFSNNHVYLNGKDDDGNSIVSGSRGHGLWFDTTTDANGHSDVMRYNIVRDNLGQGIRIEKSSNTDVYYNLVYNNSVGIHLYQHLDGNEVFNNVFCGNTCGIAIEGDNTADDVINNLIKNNISIESTSTEFIAKYGAENDGVVGYGNLYSNNCFGEESSNFVMWGNGSYHSAYDAWISACDTTPTGACDNLVQAAPRFKDAANDDFRLRWGSPCIDTGYNNGEDHDDALDPRDYVFPYDTLDQDNYGPWDIGAFVYRRRYNIGKRIKDTYMKMGLGLLVEEPMFCILP